MYGRYDCSVGIFRRTIGVNRCVTAIARDRDQEREREREQRHARQCLAGGPSPGNRPVGHPREYLTGKTASSVYLHTALHALRWHWARAGPTKPRMPSGTIIISLFSLHISIIIITVHTIPATAADSVTLSTGSPMLAPISKYRS